MDLLIFPAKSNTVPVTNGLNSRWTGDAVLGAVMRIFRSFWRIIRKLRRILPKGRSFDDLTQEDISLMMDHINSYKRKKLNNRSPYETFSFYYGEDVLKKLGCSPVAAEDIILKPKLLKK